jgi:hypothetical protein
MNEMTTVQFFTYFFAFMYAALVIVAEMVYLFLDDLLSWRKYRKMEKRYETEWRKIIFGKIGAE